MKINITDEQRDWLYKFSEFHKLTSPEECVQKLIDIYSSWNRKIEDDGKQSIFICNSTDKDIKINYGVPISEDEEVLEIVTEIKRGSGKRFDFDLTKFMIIT